MQQQFIDLSDDNPPTSTCATCGMALQPTSRTHGICPNCPDAKLVLLPADMHGKFEQLARRAERQEREQKRRSSPDHQFRKLLKDLRSGKVRFDVSGILGKGASK